MGIKFIEVWKIVLLIGIIAGVAAWHFILKKMIKEAPTLVEDKDGNLYPNTESLPKKKETSALQAHIDGFVKLKSLQRCMQEELIIPGKMDPNQFVITTNPGIPITKGMIYMLGNIHNTHHARNEEMIITHEYVDRIAVCRPDDPYDWYIFPIEFIEK